MTSRQIKRYHWLEHWLCAGGAVMGEIAADLVTHLFFRQLQYIALQTVELWNFHVHTLCADESQKFDLQKKQRWASLKSKPALFFNLILFQYPLLMKSTSCIGIDFFFLFLFQSVYWRATKNITFCFTE